MYVGSLTNKPSQHQSDTCPKKAYNEIASIATSVFQDQKPLGTKKELMAVLENLSIVRDVCKNDTKPETFNVRELEETLKFFSSLKTIMTQLTKNLDNLFNGMKTPEFRKTIDKFEVSKTPKKKHTSKRNRTRRGNKKNCKNGNRNNYKKRQAAEPVSKSTKEIKIPEKAMPLQTYSQEEIREIYYANLQNKSSFSEMSRVARWHMDSLNIDYDAIRNFSDKNSLGEEIYKYATYSNEKIYEMLLKHCLPGTERLRERPYRDVYTYTTATGFAMIGILNYKGIEEEGILFFGCDRKKIYHRMFEHSDFKDFEQLHPETLIDSHEIADSELKEEAQGFSFQVREKAGEIFFQYSDYSFRVLPIRRDLLAKELP